ncbi:head maturation protease [Pseudomonas phage Noxifer]|uniref:Virion structural protein n=1 Tax=Pseudomonas phage Noxifer TaxID=2006684 RepID=A0A1Y0SVC1_9CAUD|nr:head maturation protease [Pseudomonas phage Noxifer]ARV77360.1 hypothetical protein NOXIFER_191 [Pseudomonas phage Noxifer]
MQSALRQSVRIGSTMLAGTNKRGILQPDAEGYYPCPVGAYNAYNSGGYLYDQRTGVAMFNEGSVLMRQVRKGALYGEYKHPEQQPGMSDQAYVARVRRIDPDRYSHHIRDYELRPSTDEHGRPIILVIAWVKPFGPYGKYVEASLQNPAQNTYFSVRSITVDDMMERIKYTKEVVTHDFVGEGGVYVACKAQAPSLEDFDTSVKEITPEVLHDLARQQERRRGLGLEDNGADYAGLIKELGWERVKRTPTTRKPSFMRW